MLRFESGQVQLWDACNLKFMQNILNFDTVILAVEWKREDITMTLSDESFTAPCQQAELESLFPSSNFIVHTKERLLLVDNKSLMRHIVVEGKSVKAINAPPHEIPLKSVSFMDCKGNLMVLADTETNIVFYNAKMKSYQMYQNKGQEVTGIRFGQSPGTPLVAITFNEFFQIWNAVTLTLVYDSKHFIHSKIVGLDWATPGLVVALLGDGTLQTVDVLQTHVGVLVTPFYHGELTGFILQKTHLRIFD